MSTQSSLYYGEATYTKEVEEAKHFTTSKYASEAEETDSYEKRKRERALEQCQKSQATEKKEAEKYGVKTNILSKQLARQLHTSKQAGVRTRRDNVTGSRVSEVKVARWRSGAGGTEVGYNIHGLAMSVLTRQR